MTVPRAAPVARMMCSERAAETAYCTRALSVLERAGAQRPGLKALVVSGCPPAVHGQDRQWWREQPHLAKPFSVRSLQDAVVGLTGPPPQKAVTISKLILRSIPKWRPMPHLIRARSVALHAACVCRIRARLPPTAITTAATRAAIDGLRQKRRQAARLTVQVKDPVANGSWSSSSAL